MLFVLMGAAMRHFVILFRPLFAVRSLFGNKDALADLRIVG
jgi:hypothetical protein